MGLACGEGARAGDGGLGRADGDEAEEVEEGAVG